MVLLVFVALFLVKSTFPTISLAICTTQPLVRRGCITPGITTGCYTGGTLYCCNTQNDCDALKAGDLQSSGIDQSSNLGIDPTKPSEDPGSSDVHGACGPNGIDTAIGCIPVLGGQEEFLGFLLKWAIGVGSGIAFLLILYAGFMIMTAAGNPERLKAGQELITSAISGLVLLIFSIFVLRFIGIDILGLDQFGFGK